MSLFSPEIQATGQYESKGIIEQLNNSYTMTSVEKPMALSLRMVAMFLYTIFIDDLGCCSS